MASHDLQEPLRKIKLFSDLLRMDLDPSPPVAENLAKIDDAIRRMRALIQNLLAYSKVSVDDAAREQVSLNDVLSEVLLSLDADVQQTGAEITVGLLPVIDASAFQMRQLFQNLLANALKFRKSDVPPRVQVAAAETAKEFVIEAADNGIGFEPQFSERILQPFQRLHSRSEYDGTGLGLPICDRIMRRHGGSIAASGTLGEGAVFTLRFPKGKPSGG